MLRILQLTIVFVAVAASASGQATKAAAAAAPKWKAIWEPIPFGQDIELTAISCAGPEACWAVGAKSTILYTSDGGTTWQAQLGGDPGATDEDLAELFVLDPQHAWVMSERHRVMGTADGANWTELGKVPGTSRALTFLSPQIGMVADHSDSQTVSHLNRSQDGGASWTRADPCETQATIDGLSRKLGCMVHNIQFVSPAIGFMGGGAPVTMGTDVAVFSTTMDGGATFSHAVIAATKHRVESLHFWSDKAGLAVLSGGEALWTADGGATWTGSANAPAWKSFYASGEGKIIVGVNENGRQAGYSFNGGRTFSSRPLGLPAPARAVTFPDAQHGYLVGQHGMAYRYRIVPIEYNVQGMIAAAAAPSQ
jgi:photosystem II stability/assembly factor-like uncharacterized protein